MTAELFPKPRLSCRECGREADEVFDTIEEAEAAGWREFLAIEPSDDLLDWETHLGTCPACMVRELEARLKKTK